MLAPTKDDHGTVDLVLTDGELEAYSPQSGRYFLYQRLPTEFVVEDYEQRVEFPFDNDGQVVRALIISGSATPYVMERVLDESFGDTRFAARLVSET